MKFDAAGDGEAANKLMELDAGAIPQQPHDMQPSNSGNSLLANDSEKTQPEMDCDPPVIDKVEIPDAQPTMQNQSDTVGSSIVDDNLQPESAPAISNDQAVVHGISSGFDTAIEEHASLASGSSIFPRDKYRDS